MEIVENLWSVLNKRVIWLDEWPNDWIFLFAVFAELVLKQEQEEYLREGIEWQNVDYFNNQVICELVERPHLGVFAIMDEACLNVGKVTDEVILNNWAQASRNLSTEPDDFVIEFQIENFAFIPFSFQNRIVFICSAWSQLQADIALFKKWTL